LQLKIATWDDYPDIMDMARKFFDLTPYAKLVDYDESKMSDVIMSLFDNPTERIAILAVDNDGKTVGMLCAMVSEILFTRDRVASELAWWIDPEHRASRVSIDLINAFEFWAKEKAQCRYTQLATVETEQVDRISKFYKRKGYDLYERGFLKKVKTQ
jgi:GNAT superfamily N-acetyltransferase